MSRTTQKQENSPSAQGIQYYWLWRLSSALYQDTEDFCKLLVLTSFNDTYPVGLKHIPLGQKTLSNDVGSAKTYNFLVWHVQLHSKDRSPAFHCKVMLIPLAKNKITTTI